MHVSVTSAGSLMMYPSLGNGKFNTAVKVGTGYQAYNQVRGHGDYTGDAKPDVVVRNTAGTLYLLKGTGKATSEIFATGVKIGFGWTGYHTIA